MSRKDSVLKVLQSHLDELHHAGVERIAVFGSVARGEDEEGSDVDILVEFGEGKSRSRNFHAVCDILDELIGEPYDLVTVGGLSPYMGPGILEDAVYVEAAS